MSKSTKRIVSYVTPKEYRRAVKLAKANRRSVSDYVRMLLEDEYLELRASEQAESRSGGGE